MFVRRQGIYQNFLNMIYLQSIEPPPPPPPPPGGPGGGGWRGGGAAEKAEEHKVVQHTLLVKGEGQVGDAELKC